MGMIGLLLVPVCSNCTFINKLIQRDKNFYVHQVKWEGETLSIIAKWYTGSVNNWKTIAKANPALDPNRIVIGIDVRIPDSLLITRNSLPKSFLAGFSPEKKIKPPPPETHIRPEPADTPAPVRKPPRTEPVKKEAPSEKSRPPEVPVVEIRPTIVPRTEPAIKPVPADQVKKPVSSEKDAPPIMPSPANEKKQLPPETSRTSAPAEKPLPAGPSSIPETEQKPPQPGERLLPENDEPPLFGPRGYSN